MTIRFSALSKVFAILFYRCKCNIFLTYLPQITISPPFLIPLNENFLRINDENYTVIRAGKGETFRFQFQLNKSMRNLSKNINDRRNFDYYTAKILHDKFDPAEFSRKSRKKFYARDG